MGTAVFVVVDGTSIMPLNAMSLCKAELSPLSPIIRFHLDFISVFH